MVPDQKVSPDSQSCLCHQQLAVSICNKETFHPRGFRRIIQSKRLSRINPSVYPQVDSTIVLVVAFSSMILEAEKTTMVLFRSSKEHILLRSVIERKVCKTGAPLSLQTANNTCCIPTDYKEMRSPKKITANRRTSPKTLMKSLHPRKQPMTMSGKPRARTG